MPDLEAALLGERRRGLHGAAQVRAVHAVDLQRRQARRAARRPAAARPRAAADPPTRACPARRRPTGRGGSAARRTPSGRRSARSRRLRDRLSAVELHDVSWSCRCAGSAPHSTGATMPARRDRAAPLIKCPRRAGRAGVTTREHPIPTRLPACVLALVAVVGGALDAGRSRAGRRQDDQGPGQGPGRGERASRTRVPVRRRRRDRCTTRPAPSSVRASPTTRASLVVPRRRSRRLHRGPRRVDAAGRARR